VLDNKWLPGNTFSCAFERADAKDVMVNLINKFHISAIAVYPSHTLTQSLHQPADREPRPGRPPAAPAGLSLAESDQDPNRVLSLSDAIGVTTARRTAPAAAAAALARRDRR
jgi:hypothetical protein